MWLLSASDPFHNGMILSRDYISREVMTCDKSYPIHQFGEVGGSRRIARLVARNNHQVEFGKILRFPSLSADPAGNLTRNDLI